MKKGIAEFIGTFVLVLFSTGTAVLGGVDNLGISMAFGLSIVAMAYSIGTISGCHVNPAVSIAMFINKRISVPELIYYLVGQVLGAIAGTAVLYLFLSISNLSVENLGQNSFGNFDWSGAFLVEVILTFVFVLVILIVTGKNGTPKLAGLVIGFTLVLIHLLGIPLTGTSVNPARSLAPAFFVGGEALRQLWVFILAPIVGAAIAAIVSRSVLDSEEN